jgi:hypothetical protein
LAGHRAKRDEVKPDHQGDPRDIRLRGVPLAVETLLGAVTDGLVLHARLDPELDAT